MPVFEVSQYFTYADRFTVYADSAAAAADLVTEWYDNQPASMPEPLALQDADVAPMVDFTDKNAFVDADGMFVSDENGDSEEF